MKFYINIQDPILRLCLAVMGASLLMLVAIFGISYKKACDEVLDDSIRLAQQNVQTAKEVVERHLNSIEVTTLNLASTRLTEYRDSDIICNLLQRFVESSPDVFGIAVCYEPDIIPGHRQGFGPYVYKRGGGLVNSNLLHDGNDYLHKPWYQPALNADSGIWTKPFRNIKGELLACFTYPLKDKQGKRIGVIAADLQLEDFTEKLVREICPFDSTEFMVLDQNLDFIAHPCHSLILTPLEAMFESRAQRKSTEKSESLVVKMKEKITGHFTFAKGTKYEGMVFFAPVSQTRWTVALSFTKAAVFEDSQNMAWNMFWLCLSGTLLMVGCMGWVFSKIRKVVETKAGIESELSLAHEIQMAMVNKVYPAYPERQDIDIYASLIPAKDVGGDLYDFALKGDILHFCVGDVSGKGVPASLFMTICRTLYRSNIDRETSPAKIAEALNRSVAADNKKNMFITMYICALNLKTGELTVCNCGHNLPLISTSGESIRYLQQPPTNIPIGVVEDFRYKEFSTRVQPGSIMVLYTDGITEAENNTHSLFGEDRLLNEANALSQSTEAQWDVKHILAAVRSYSEGCQQSDDITLLSIHYNGKQTQNT